MNKNMKIIALIALLIYVISPMGKADGELMTKKDKRGCRTMRHPVFFFWNRKTKVSPIVQQVQMP